MTIAPKMSGLAATLLRAVATRRYQRPSDLSLLLRKRHASWLPKWVTAFLERAAPHSTAWRRPKAALVVPLMIHPNDTLRMA